MRVIQDMSKSLQLPLLVVRNCSRESMALMPVAAPPWRFAPLPTMFQKHYFYAQIRCKKRSGRGFYAKENISAGSLLIRERPYASVLHESLTDYMCAYCCKPLPSTFLPCTRCADEQVRAPNLRFSPLLNVSKVRFCDDMCRDIADATFHEFECTNNICIYQMSRVCDNLTLKLALCARCMSCMSVDEIKKYFVDKVPPDEAVVNGVSLVL